MELFEFEELHMKHIVIYVHGKGGSAAEAAHYGPLFCDAGFTILDAQECWRPIKFYDVGALVWFARIIEWEFPGFSVERCRDRLLRAQELLERNGCIEGRIHRFLLVCKK